MYLNVGAGSVINTDEIIGIFDLDITSQSHITRKFLVACEKEDHLINTTEDIPKSFVVCNSGNINEVYFCQPAVTTLIKRAENDLIGGKNGGY